MADFCADHEIVTNFLLNICQLRQSFNFDTLRALCSCATTTTQRLSSNDDETAYIPVITGSAAEFYIQPMLNVEC